MKCPECGSENPEDTKFCGQCGKKLPEIEPKKEELKEPETEPKKAGLWGISNKKIIPILFAVVVLIGAIGLYFAYTSFMVPLSPQNSTVFIDSTVSGAAEVVDPTNNKTYTVTIDYYGIGGGSGFIVNGDGYIVTAAHVVSDPWELENKGKIKKMDDDDIKWYVDKAAVGYFLKQYYPDIYNNMTEEDLEDMTNQFIEAGAVHATNYEHNIYIRGPAFPDSVEDPPVARLVDFGDSNTEIDIALLKVDNVGGLPALKLSSQKIEVGSDVRIYGYPTEQFEFYKYLSEKGQKKTCGSPCSLQH